ncbi:RNA-guided endonuclease InsQ/TnpB family protein [Actinopolyspora halophila]|uniref:RNA-guided endonuclease InsQ/TnpB family protein n=1 Tax=Actinopolyspora halophila TaxID=1850 RepID=UPI0003757A2D|nr:RNA-guided endonuclease TnpB family protein [Actinopolyspora halophila]
MRFRLYPTPEQERVLTEHCAAARFVWNLAVEQHSHWQPGRRSGPGWAEQCRQLTEARSENDWFAAWNSDVCQQALKDYHHARTAFFQSGFGEPTWRKKYRNEGFRIIGGGREPDYEADGSPKLNRTGKQVMTRRVAVQKLNRRWAQVKLPSAGWVRFRLTVRQLPHAKTCRVTWKNGQWHVAFAIQPEPVAKPGNGNTAGVDRGVEITAALHDGQTLNCPQPSSKERAKRRKHERRAARAPKNSQAKADEYAQVAKLRARETSVRKDWVEKTSTMLASQFDAVRFEKLNIRTMARSAKGTEDNPGRGVKQKAGLNRAILAQGWGLLRARTEDKAPGRVTDVPAPYTSLRCSSCGWIEKNSRKSQAEFVCVSCGFSCNADTNAAINVAAGRAGGTTPPAGGASVREPTAA